MDVDTHDLLRESVRQLLHCDDVDLVAGLAELGWHEVVSDDPAGAFDLLFTVQGRTGRASAYLDTLLVDAAGGDLRRDQDAQRPMAVVHPIGDAMCHESEGRLLIDGVVLSDLRVTGACVVAFDSADAAVYMLESGRLADVARRVLGFDSGSALRRVRIEISMSDVEERRCDWGAAVAAGRRALASELVGNGLAMLDIAIDHARQRTQFGRPIGVNQTPRHRLAECHACLAGARGLIDAAWKSGTSWDGWIAKTYAGYASDATSRASLQVCGAIGLTWEHVLGGHVKRARVLDALYGGWRSSTQDIGMTLLRTETIPTGPRM